MNLLTKFKMQIRADNADNFLKFSGEHLKTNHFQNIDIVSFFHGFIIQIRVSKVNIITKHIYIR